MMSEIGTPLIEALNGSSIERSGTQVCGGVLNACGFDVAEAGGDGVVTSVSMSPPRPSGLKPFL